MKKRSPGFQISTSSWLAKHYISTMQKSSLMHQFIFQLFLDVVGENYMRRFTGAKWWEMNLSARWADHTWLWDVDRLIYNIGKACSLLCIVTLQLLLHGYRRWLLINRLASNISCYYLITLCVKSNEFLYI